MKHDLVYILWLDAHSQDEWTDNLDSAAVKCETIGIIAKETDEVISITHTRQLLHDTYCCTIHIPKCCIIERRALKAVAE
jgi:hypothetical protein